VAEYLDLLYALHELVPHDTAGQLTWLQRLNTYVYRKHGHVEGHPELAQRPAEKRELLPEAVPVEPAGKNTRKSASKPTRKSTRKPAG
jgi:hypothetical protein